MAKYWQNEVELADVQATIGILEYKVEYFKKYYPYAYREIANMINALQVLDDLEDDIASED